ncbi:MAG TPA: ABC transporter ATP-binding protein [Acidimicrobiales bacterium]|nr:ABC transporter ATP-binding protein [Acidimicrobiales bacterium]
MGAADVGFEDVVVADGVRKLWGETVALDNATFRVGRGVTGLLGANGSGKTTTLGLLLGMHAPDAGTLTVLGLDPATQGAEIRALVGYAPEHDSLPPDVAAYEVVTHLAELRGLPRREAAGRASDVLFELGLGEERLRPVGTMSTGQRQRVKLAQAIAADPQLVLLDEPTNGLDPMQREEMLRLVRRVADELGIHVLLSSHLLEEVERVADAVVILDHGRTVATGNLADLEAGNGSIEVMVTFDGDTDKLMSSLKTNRVSARALEGGGRVLVTITNGATYDKVRDAVVTSKVSLRSLKRQRETLEDVFFAASEPEGAEV